MEEVKAKSILDKIKEIFNGEETVAKEKVATPETEEKKKFVSATLEDGTQVEIEPELVEGAAVVVIVDGNPQVAPDGSHTLADGTVIETVGGAIVSIVPAEEEVEEEMEEAPAVEEKQDVKKIVESIIKESHFVSEEKVTELVEAIKEEFNAKLEEKIKEVTDATVQAFEAFGKEEKVEPTKKPVDAYGREKKKTSWAERFNSKK